MHAKKSDIIPEYSSIELKTIKGENIKLREILTARKLIIHYSKLSCNSCIENEFKLLKELAGKIGIENIIMIAVNKTSIIAT